MLYLKKNIYYIEYGKILKLKSQTLKCYFVTDVATHSYTQFEATISVILQETLFPFPFPFHSQWTDTRLEVASLCLIPILILQLVHKIVQLTIES